MKRFNLIILSLLCVTGLLIGIVGANVALLKNTYNGSETGTIPTPPKVLALSFTVDGQSWINNTAMKDWGSNLVAGQTVTRTIAIANTGNVAVSSITLTPDSNLPSGWTETISALAAPLSPGATAIGTITLTPSASAAPGAYAWNTIITANQ